MKLGAWLLSKGKITEDQLQRALQHQQFFGGRIGTSLIKLGYIDEDVLGAFLSDVSGSPYAPPALLDSVPPQVRALIPARLAAQYRVVPLGVEGKRLRLAMRDPKDLMALDEMAFLTGMSIEPYVSTDFRIQKALTQYYDVAPPGSAIPVENQPAPRAPASSRPVPAARPGPAEVGLDGYPLDADPDQISGAASGRRAGVPAASWEDSESRPPTSLDQWRIAQDEIPDEIPLPETRAEARPAGAPLEAGAAAAALSRPSETPVVALSRPVEAPALPVPAASPSIAPAPAHLGTTGPMAAVSPEPSAPPPAAPAATNVVDAGPAGLDSISARLQAAETRDQVFEAVLDFWAARFQRTLLFIVHPDRVAGWSGRGAGVDPARVRQVSVALDRPSLFSFVRTGADHYDGPVGDLPANTRFFLDLGCPAPARALLMCLLIKDRPALVVYADNAADAVALRDLSVCRRLLAKATLALEILILRKKIGSL